MAKKMGNSQAELNFLLDQLGNFGKYQFRQHFLHCLAYFTSAIHMMGFLFVFPIMEHRCYLEGIDGDLSMISEIEKRIPTTEEGKLASCEKYDEFANETNSNSTLACGEDGYAYNSNYFQSSRIIEWDMVCDQAWMRAMLQVIFILGSLLGSFIGGALADRFGRKPILCFSGILQFFWGFGVVFQDNYYASAFSMLMYGMFGSGSTNGPALALTMELVGTSKRPLCGAMLSLSYGVGSVIVSIWAYYLSGDARILQLIYVAHSLLLFANWWLVDESIRWLWARGKKDEAMQLLGKAATVNGVELTFPETIRRPSTLSKRRSTLAEVLLKRQQRNTISFLDVFRTPEIRKRLLVSMYVWAATGVLYYGMYFNSVTLSGNPYVIFILSILVEIPSHPITAWLCPKTGYKPMLMVNLILPGVACVVLANFPRNFATVSVAVLTKISITCATSVLNAYTSELFPTVLRNTAVGIGIMSSRFGATVIPVINLLGNHYQKIAGVGFGVTAIVGGGLVLIFLPETYENYIPQTVEDVEGPEKRKKEEDIYGYQNNPAYEIEEM